MYLTLPLSCPARRRSVVAAVFVVGVSIWQTWILSRLSLWVPHRCRSRPPRKPDRLRRRQLWVLQWPAPSRRSGAWTRRCSASHRASMWTRLQLKPYKSLDLSHGTLSTPPSTSSSSSTSLSSARRANEVLDVAGDRRTRMDRKASSGTIVVPRARKERKVSTPSENVLLDEEVLTDPLIQALLLTVLVSREPQLLFLYLYVLPSQQNNYILVCLCIFVLNIYTDLHVVFFIFVKYIWCYIFYIY